MGIIEDVSHSTINMKIKKKCDSGPLSNIIVVGSLLNCFSARYSPKYNRSLVTRRPIMEDQRVMTHNYSHDSLI